MKHPTKVLMAALLCIISQYACKPGNRQEPVKQSAVSMYTYSFEERPALTRDDSQRRIKDLMGESDFKNLVQSQENIVYFTSEKDLNDNLEQDLNTGNFTFNKGMSKYMGDFTPKLPGAEEAARMVETYLRGKSLFPKDQAQLKLVHQGGLRSMNVVGGSKAGPVVDKLVTLTYGRLLDSMSVIGPGSKIVAQVGEGGEVVGLVYRWRELNMASKKAIEPANMNSQQEAEALAKQQIAAEYGEKSSFSTKNVYRAYYDNNGGILQPVYVFETTVTLEDKKVRPFDYLCVIPVMKNSPEPLRLIQTDGRAKEMIRNIQKGEGTKSDPKNRD